MTVDRLGTHRKNIGWNLLSLLALVAIGSPFACNSAETVDGTSGPTAAVTNGTGYDPICEGGMRDGFCNALGAKPESCMCLDCAQTAYCKMTCKNDGNCDTATEDCTCIDCVGKEVNGNPCQLSMGNGNGNGPATSNAATTTTTGAGGGGGAGSTTASTTVASTTAATTAASTAASTSTGM